jgi:hypothetical protein
MVYTSKEGETMSSHATKNTFQQSYVRLVNHLPNSWTTKAPNDPESYHHKQDIYWGYTWNKGRATAGWNWIRSERTVHEKIVISQK